MLERYELAAAIDGHADRVEADRGRCRARVARVAEPRARQSPDARPLAWTQPRQRLLPRAKRPPRRPRQTRLYLHERERPSVKDDQVDLAVPGADVTCERREAE